MNYYEELGLESSASPEEIRRAYRKLAQVLHPDQHRDEALRRVCERQLARLNGIAEILEDPGRRLEYDLSLQEARERREELGPGRLELVREFVSSLSLATWVWATAALLGIALIASLFRWNAISAGETPYRAPGGPEEAREEAKADEQSAPAADAARAIESAPAWPPKARRVPEARAEVDRFYSARLPLARSEPSPSTARLAAAAIPLASLPEVEPEQPAPVVAPEPTGAPVAAPNREEAPQAPPPALVQPPAPAQPPRPERSYFAGRWFFSHDVSERDRRLYPPEMIELAIAEENGSLRGSYRSRYRVTDRPISPDVDFEFAGPAGKGEAVELGWSGSGGAQGRVRLRPIPRASMEVNWWAPRLGSLGLVSGTAVLIRGDER